MSAELRKVTNTVPNNKQRGKQALENLNKELKSRRRKEKARPLGVVIASVVAIVAIVGSIWVFATQENGQEDITASEENNSEESAKESPAPEAQALTGKRAEALPASVSCEYKENGEDSNGATIPNGENVSAEGTVTVELDTTHGPIGMKLDRAASPCTVNAIESLASEGYYDDTVCHRMTSGGLSVLQCGDPTGSGSGGPGFNFDNEYPTEADANQDQPVTYPRGSIAMANTGQPGTNGSQFFLNYDDSQLPPTYTYFGTITEEGMKTLDAIAEKGVEGGAPDGAPAEEVRIKKAKVA